VQGKWVTELHRLHDASFQHDWERLAGAINRQFALTGDAELQPSIKGLPPIWFQGDVERIQSGNWVLVMSLNHQRANPGEYVGESRETMWDLQCQHHRQHWYTGFNGPLARLAALSMGQPVENLDLAWYADNHVVFTELCPHASKSFALDANTVAHLARSDPAFQMAEEIRSVLLDQARPALVLVNGGRALAPFETVYRARFAWQLPREEYVSCDPVRPGRTPKMLWHQQGVYDAPGGPVPVIGFPFLRKPWSHNSYAEIGQLGERTSRFRQAVQGGARPPST
jgi:hypothetical protein